MKIFFLMRNSIYLRNYESVVRLLADRGHQILLGFGKIDEAFSEAAITELVNENSRISYIMFSQRTWLWRRPADFIRVLQTYARFLDGRYKDSHKLRARAASLLPDFIRRIVKMIVGHNDSKRWSFIHFLRRIESAIPLDSFILKFFNNNRPDLFLITPLIDLHVKQLDWLKCAKSLGIRSGLCVASWDNLSNKSLIQTEPDAVIVWNEIQQQEAVELHHIPASKVVVTGAQCYDRLFAHQPSTSKEEFFSKVGLVEEGDYLLYLCSSRFIAPNEVDFIRKWILRLRSSGDPALNKIGVLVRPHPQNATQWRDIDLSDSGNVALYPQKGANPIRGNSFDDFFDSMYHSVATVGINTSAMIESGILNKPVFTILSPQFRNTQNGTLHFNHLVEGGLLNISSGLDEHIEQLGRVLAGREAYQTRIRHFIKSFVRPHGLEVACTPIFVKSLENFIQRMISSSTDNSWKDTIVRLLLFPWAALSYASKKANEIISKERDGYDKN
jgi:hypothetical protein